MKRPSASTIETSRLLLLIRHGKAAPKDVGLSDFERILTKSGAETCYRVAAKLARKKLSIDLMLSSPADRAHETAHLFALSLGYPFQKIGIVEALYSPGTIVPMLGQLKRLPVSVRTVALFGHNPLFDELAAYLIPGFSQSIPKGAVAAISFGVGSWADLKNVTGRLQFLISPLGHSKNPVDLQDNASRYQPKQSAKRAGTRQ